MSSVRIHYHTGAPLYPFYLGVILGILILVALFLLIKY